MFAVTERAVGRTAPKRRTTLEFPYQSGLKVISMKTPCDCTTIYDVPKDNLIRVVYEAKPVPPQLKMLGHYSVRKEVIITWENPDGAQQETKLYFTATIYE